MLSNIYRLEFWSPNCALDGHPDGPRTDHRTDPRKEPQTDPRWIRRLTLRHPIQYRLLWGLTWSDAKIWCFFVTPQAPFNCCPPTILISFSFEIWENNSQQWILKLNKDDLVSTGQQEVDKTGKYLHVFIFKIFTKLQNFTKLPIQRL